MECYVKRTHWKKLPVPILVINKMNEFPGIMNIAKFSDKSMVVSKEAEVKEP